MRAEKSIIQPRGGIADPDQEVHRVLDTLDRWEERLNLHYGAMRGFERKAFRSQVLIAIPPAPPSPRPNEPFRVWARNVSQGGVSFVYRVELSATKLFVGLLRGDQEPLWFRGEVVRARSVHEGYWEYGVRFLERATPPEPPSYGH
ncbi:MAG TPA: PilZ domain-containing protein [Planctomycetaceae bacterium]|nr:PilZ domain-containing protein [Planctomycetaceae bacterium]